MSKALFLLILIINSLAQDEYIFWAKLSNKNLLLFHEEQNISPVMRESKELDLDFACELDYKNIKKQFPKLSLPPKSKKEKLIFLQKVKYDLLNCFVGAKIFIKSFTNTKSENTVDDTYVKISPLRFFIDFKSKSAIIYTLNKGK